MTTRAVRQISSLSCSIKKPEEKASAIHDSIYSKDKSESTMDRSQPTASIPTTLPLRDRFLHALHPLVRLCADRIYCHSLSAAEARLRDQKIGIFLATDYEHIKNEIHVVIFGSSSSRQAALSRRVMITAQNEESLEVRMSYARRIQTRIVCEMSIALDRMKHEEYDFEKHGSQEYAKLLAGFAGGDEREELAHGQLLAATEKLWANEDVRKNIEAHLADNARDSAEYFFAHISRIARVEYVPTTEDVIYCRSTVSGLTETTLGWSGRRIRLFSVNGNCHPLKWLRTFASDGLMNGRGVLVFTADLSTWDTILHEEQDPSLSTTLLHDALVQFGSIARSRYFIGAKVFLVLTGMEVYEAKFEENPARQYWPDLEQDVNPSFVYCAKDFILRLFAAEIRKDDQDRTLYAHLVAGEFDDVEISKFLQAILAVHDDSGSERPKVSNNTSSTATVMACNSDQQEIPGIESKS